MQWLKLHDRKDVYKVMVDKYEVKKYVADLIGSEYIIPTLGIWNKFEEINFNDLPNEFVLKCTHDSGGVFLCRDKSKMNLKNIRIKFKLMLNRNFYYRNREWPYKSIKHRIIAEKFMGNNLNDYKLFCFNGEPELILVCSDRKEKSGLKEDFFDKNWNHLDIKRPKHPNSTKKINRPENLNNMIELSRKLSSGTKFLRVDFYEIGGKLYFGELTFFPAGGFETFEPAEWELKLGDLLKIDEEDA